MHTRNRPDFVERAIRYYADKFKHRLIITDASTEPNFAVLKSTLADIKVGFPLDILHHHADTPFYSRLAETVEKVTTPNVLFMADDDFYFESWPQHALAHMASDPACGVVYGQTLHFEVPGYVPWGEPRDFAFSRPNPVARWMDHDTPAERLAELGKGPFAVLGWYAVQRVEIFKRFISAAIATRLDLYNGERFLTMLQPSLGKVSMIDVVYLARQTNPNVDSMRPLPGFDARQLEDLEDVTIDVLVEGGMGRAAARDVVLRTTVAERSQLESNERRKRLRIDPIKRAIPFAQQAITTVKRALRRERAVEPLAQDARFPPIPPLSAVAREMAIVREACRR